MSNVIILYDIPSTLKVNAWSPNTWKARYSLNYKGLAYKTVWVEYPDIASICKEIGAEPTDFNPDGSRQYTLPVIKDPSTGAVVADSIKIVEYLDKTYPNTPKLLPVGTNALQEAFQVAYMDAVLLGAWFKLALPASNKYLNPRSEEYFRRTREQKYGQKLEDISPKDSSLRTEHWAEIKKGHDVLDSWLEKNGKGQKWVFGNQITYADVTVASFLYWFKLVLPEEWEQLASLNGGRWATFVKDFDRYSNVV